MKNTKRLLTALLIVVMLVACMLIVTSCNDDHEHSYTTEVVPPNCTAQGYTKYTCECGDTYNDNFVPATHLMTPHPAKAPTCTEVGHSAYIGCDGCGEKEGYEEIPKIAHNLVAEITEYPSATKAGKKKLDCSECDYYEEETIAAFTASLPDVSKAIGSMIEEGKYSLTAKDGSTLILVREFAQDESGSITHNGQKVFLAFNVAKAEISSKNSVVQGYLKLEFGTAIATIDGTVPSSEITAPEKFDSAGAVEIYLNGDDVSISVVFNGVTEVEEEVAINEAFYSALADTLGISYEDLITSIYIGEKVQTIVPSATAIVAALESVKLPEINGEFADSYMLLFSTVAGEMVTVTTDEDGNNVYTLDVAALTEFVEAVEGKTVVQFLNEAYGADNVAMLFGFISSIPNMTVFEITNSVSALANALGIEVAQAYDLIDMLIYSASETNVSIQSEIKKNYNRTVADLVADQQVANNPYLTHEDAVLSFKANIASAIATVSNLTIDDLYNMYVLASGAEIKEGFSITTEIKTMLAGLSDVITAEVVVDAEGNLLSLEATLPNAVITLGYEEDTLVASVTYLENVVEITVSNNEINVDLINGEATIANVSLTYESSVELEVVTEIYTLHVTSGKDVLVDASVTIVDAVFSNATLIINGYESATENESEKDTSSEGENASVISGTEEELVEESTLVNYANIRVDYSVSVEDSTKGLTIQINDAIYAVELINSSEQSGIGLILADSEGTLLFAIIGMKETTVEDELTSEKYSFIVADTDNILFSFAVEFANGAFVGAGAEMNAYETLTNEETKETTQELKNIFQASVGKENDGNGSETIYLSFNEYMLVVNSVKADGNSSLSIDVMVEDTVIANLTAKAETVTVTENETTTTTNNFTLDVTLGEDVLVDLDATATDGALTKADVIVNFYYTAIEDVYDTETGEVIGSNEVLKLDKLLDIEIAIDKNVITVDDKVSGDTAKIELLDNGLKMTVNKTVILATLTETVEEGVATGFEVTGFEFSFNVTDADDVLLDISVTNENGMLTDVTIFAQDYQTNQAFDPETGMPVGEPVRVFTTLVDYKYNVTITESGIEFIYYFADGNDVYYDVEYKVELLENGVTLTYDINKYVVGASFIELHVGSGETADKAPIEGPLTPISSEEEKTEEEKGDDAYLDVETEDYVSMMNYLITVYFIEGEGAITFTYDPAA